MIHGPYNIKFIHVIVQNEIKPKYPETKTKPYVIRVVFLYNAQSPSHRITVCYPFYSKW